MSNTSKVVLATVAGLMFLGLVTEVIRYTDYEQARVASFFTKCDHAGGYPIRAGTKEHDSAWVCFKKEAFPEFK